jgi:hypothetical protein
MGLRSIGFTSVESTSRVRHLARRAVHDQCWEAFLMLIQPVAVRLKPFMPLEAAQSRV